MSEAVAKTFLEWLSKNPEAEEELLALLEAGDEDEETKILEDFAKTKGFSLNIAEFEDALAAAGYGVTQARSVSEMSFPELDSNEGGFYFHQRLSKRLGGGRKPRRKPYKGTKVTDSND